MGFVDKALSALGVFELRRHPGALLMLRRCAGEFVGTAALVALGCGAGSAEMGGVPSRVQAG